MCGVQGVTRSAEQGAALAEASAFTLILADFLLECPECRPQTRAKQSRAEGVPLFDTFGLTDASGNWALLPDERRGAT